MFADTACVRLTVNCIPLLPTLADSLTEQHQYVQYSNLLLIWRWLGGTKQCLKFMASFKSKTLFLWVSVHRTHCRVTHDWRSIESGEHKKTYVSISCLNSSRKQDVKDRGRLPHPMQRSVFSPKSSSIQALPFCWIPFDDPSSLSLIIDDQRPRPLLCRVKFVHLASSVSRITTWSVVIYILPRVLGSLWRMQ